MFESTKKQIARSLNLDVDLEWGDFNGELEMKIWDLIDVANGAEGLTEDEYMIMKTDPKYHYGTEAIVEYLADHPRTTEAGLLKVIKKLNKN